jgi:hypothetical protein
MIARAIQITLAAALIWLIAAPRPQAEVPHEHWNYLTCDQTWQRCQLS